MSHAANLRAHQQSTAATSAKRRKLSDHGTRPKVNGLNHIFNPNSSNPLKARHQQSAKQSDTATPVESGARIAHAIDNDPITEPVNGVHDISEPESDDIQDDFDGGLNKNKKTNQIRDDGRSDNVPHRPNGVSQKASEKDADDSDDNADDAEDESAEPTFGDILRSRAIDQIQVPADESNAVHGRVNQPGQLVTPSAASLGTVLTQALRSNDLPLLESCLQVSNLQSIRATVERLPSSLAATLLSKLAERMHKRPGRAGSLMVWVQWTVVAHGGYLASQPAAMSQVRELYRVVRLRATSLQPLLTLKGKLDMLEAQVALRRRRTAPSTENQNDDDVIYVESEDSSDDEGVTSSSRKTKPQEVMELESSDVDETMPLTNGTSVPASDDEDADVGLEDELESDGDENLIDDEAESTDDEDGEGDPAEEVIFDDDDDADEDDDDEEQSRRAKRSKQ